MTDGEYATMAMQRVDPTIGQVVAFQELDGNRCVTLISHETLLRKYFKSRTKVSGYVAVDGNHKRIQQGSTIMWLCAQNHDGSLLPLAWIVQTGCPLHPDFALCVVLFTFSVTYRHDDARR